MSDKRQKKKRESDGANWMDTYGEMCIRDSVEVVVAMLLAIAITRSIRKPIEECANATTEIAKGNLDVGVGYSSNDELGTLSGNINSMVGTLKSYIGEISDVLSEMADGNLAVETKEKDVYKRQTQGMPVFCVVFH